MVERKSVQVRVFFRKAKYLNLKSKRRRVFDFFEECEQNVSKCVVCLKNDNLYYDTAVVRCDFFFDPLDRRNSSNKKRMKRRCTDVEHPFSWWTRLNNERQEKLEPRVPSVLRVFHPAFRDLFRGRAGFSAWWCARDWRTFHGWSGRDNF